VVVRWPRNRRQAWHSPRCPTAVGVVPMAGAVHLPIHSVWRQCKADKLAFMSGIDGIVPRWRPLTGVNHGDGKSARRSNIPPRNAKKLLARHFRRRSGGGPPLRVPFAGKAGNPALLLSLRRIPQGLAKPAARLRVGQKRKDHISIRAELPAHTACAPRHAFTRAYDGRPISGDSMNFRSCLFFMFFTLTLGLLAVALEHDRTGIL